MTNQKLFDYMLHEHGVTLLVGDMHEIDRIVLEDHAQFEPTSLQSLIERVAAEKMCKPPKGNDDWEYNQGLDKAIEILKSTPCIQTGEDENKPVFNSIPAGFKINFLKSPLPQKGSAILLLNSDDYELFRPINDKP